MCLKFKSGASAYIYIYKCLRQSKGQSRMDNLHTVETLGTQDRGRGQRKHNTIQYTNVHISNKNIEIK